MSSSLISSQLGWEQTPWWNFEVTQSQFGTGSTGKGRGQDGLVNEVLINEVASTSASAPVAAEFIIYYYLFIIIIYTLFIIIIYLSLFICYYLLIIY